MAEWVATICAGIWAVLCVYLSIVERSRSVSVEELQSMQFYRKVSDNGVPVLIAIIFIGCGAGIYAWIGNRSSAFLVGSLMLLVMFPLSAIFVSPVTRIIADSETSNVGSAVAAMFKRWRLVHGFRTVLAVLALGFFVAGMNQWPLPL